jgi:predicted outer membrane repeat protein
MWFIKSCRMQNVIENFRKGTRSMTTRKVLFHEKLLMMGCAAAIACAGVQAATFERTIKAPDGIGDVVALTNALAELSAASNKDKMRIWLQKGTYDLRGVYMRSSHHLEIASAPGGLVAGLGDGPEETILLGGGEDGQHGVIYMNGGGNWGVNTISNLTITGGWTTSNGGGICGASSSVYRNLIVSNNYAKGTGNGAGGGGCFKGRAYNCLFADNHCTEQWGGGFATGSEGYYNRNDTGATGGQGAWNCTFVDNSAKICGGGLAINGGGVCHYCSFTNNTATSSGGAVYIHTVNYTAHGGKTSRTSNIHHGTFYGNSGKGAGVYVNTVARAPISNCVFRLNSGESTIVGGDIDKCIFEDNRNSMTCIKDSTMKNCQVRRNRGFAVNGCDLEDCVVEANTNGTMIVNDCNMTRCVMRDNVVTSRYAEGIDGCTTVGDKTNINCRIENNKYVTVDSANSAYGAILKGKALINCTILGNNAASTKWGRPLDACVLWNCVLSGNKLGTTLRDVRINKEGSGVYSVWMTNCVFSATDIASGEIGADGTVSHEGLSGCRKIAAGNLKFENAANGLYTPLRKSPLCDAGLRDAWILSAVGGVDLAGNPRVMGDGIDIGAYECQWTPVGMVISVR